MKLRCPYCKEILGAEPTSICPHCGKSMMVPDRLLKHPYRERKKIKEKIIRDARKQRASSFASTFHPGRQPATLFILLALMLLTGLALLSRTGRLGKPRSSFSREMKAEREVEVLRIALDRFRDDCRRYPNTDEGLRALVLNPGTEGWSGPYVTIIKPDPWHTPYHYSGTGTATRVFSSGPDRKPDTDDDIHPE